MSTGPSLDCLHVCTRRYDPQTGRGVPLVEDCTACSSPPLPTKLRETRLCSAPPALITSTTYHSPHPIAFSSPGPELGLLPRAPPAVALLEFHVHGGRRAGGGGRPRGLLPVDRAGMLKLIDPPVRKGDWWMSRQGFRSGGLHGQAAEGAMRRSRRWCERCQSERRKSYCFVLAPEESPGAAFDRVRRRCQGWLARRTL